MLVVQTSSWKMNENFHWNRQNDVKRSSCIWFFFYFDCWFWCTLIRLDDQKIFQIIQVIFDKWTTRTSTSFFIFSLFQFDKNIYDDWWNDEMKIIEHDIKFVDIIFFVNDNTKILIIQQRHNRETNFFIYDFIKNENFIQIIHRKKNTTIEWWIYVKNVVVIFVIVLIVNFVIVNLNRFETSINWRHFFEFHVNVSKFFFFFVFFEWSNSCYDSNILFDAKQFQKK